MTEGPGQSVDLVERVGLIGWPVEHSVSPAMHNAAFGVLQLPWHYSLLPTPPGTLGTALSDLKKRRFRGANVTVPHKQEVMPYLDKITDNARAIGAVNTILAEGGKLIGHNTDGHGFLAALRDAGFEPSGRSALVLGAGGGARAVVCALAEAGCDVTIYNRTPQRAVGLARELKDLSMRTAVARIRSAPALVDLELGLFDLLVNATSVGMWPHSGLSPWPAALPLQSHWMVYDLVYNPEETLLLSQASAAGAKPVGGLGMLVHQGALAFELWTGHSPPVGVMRAAARGALHP